MRLGRTCSLTATVRAFLLTRRALACRLIVDEAAGLTFGTARVALRLGRTCCLAATIGALLLSRRALACRSVVDKAASLTFGTARGALRWASLLARLVRAHCLATRTLAVPIVTFLTRGTLPATSTTIVVVDISVTATLPAEHHSFLLPAFVILRAALKAGTPAVLRGSNACADGVGKAIAMAPGGTAGVAIIVVSVSVLAGESTGGNEERSEEGW